MKSFPSLLLLAAAGLGGCAALTERAERERVTVINAVSWPDSVSGAIQRDKSRLSLAQAHGRTEHYPLIQIKHCKEEGKACVWGVAKVQGTIKVRQVHPDGVDLDVAMDVDIARRQEVNLPGFSMKLEIPNDITAISHQRLVTHQLTLPYGKSREVALDYGIKLDLCVARRDDAGKPLDTCPSA